MIQPYRPPRYVSEARAAVGPRRLRAFTRRVFRKRPRVCAICPSTRGLQVAHLVAVSENRALALREKNTFLLCRRCHLAFDSLVGVIPTGSRLYTDPSGGFLPYQAAVALLLEARSRMLFAYGR
jgi:5-methylcytosine-specific restriction endonuclease McrA